MPVFRRKQSDKLAATLNSPPLTWRSQRVALRNGTTPESRRWTRAPSDRRSSAPLGGIFKPLLMSVWLAFGDLFRPISQITPIIASDGLNGVKWFRYHVALRTRFGGGQVVIGRFASGTVPSPETSWPPPTGVGGSARFHPLAFTSGGVDEARP